MLNNSNNIIIYLPSWYVTIKYNLNQYCFLFVKILCSIERPAKTGYLLFIGKDYCNIFIPCIDYTMLLIHLQEQLDASKTYPSAAVKNIELIRGVQLSVLLRRR